MTLHIKGETNRRLGYPPDARLLIINADDFGMCQSITEAIFATLTAGVVASTTVMLPCPWALPALELLRANPAIPFGVHLTVICDTVTHRWGPLTPRAQVPSLVDETGAFYSFERMAEFLARAELDELETEFRAQIEAVLAAQLKPSHLDWHCVRFGPRGEIFDLMLGLAQEYGLAMRVIGQPAIAKVQSQGLPCNDYDFMDSFGIDLADKAARYAQMLRALPVGLSEWAVHPGFDTPELAALHPDSRNIRQSDYDFLISPAARELVRAEGIELLDYRALQRVWNAG